MLIKSDQVNKYNLQLSSDKYFLGKIMAYFLFNMTLSGMSTVEVAQSSDSFWRGLEEPSIKINKDKNQGHSDKQSRRAWAASI